MAGGLTYGQFQAALMSMTDIAPDKEATFNGRLKQLSRLNMPERPALGKGVRHLYSLSDLFQVALTLQLLRAGLPAERAVTIIKGNWAVFSAGVRANIGSLAQGRSDPNIAYVRSNALADLQARTSAHNAADVAVLRESDINGFTSASSSRRPQRGPAAEVVSSRENWAEFWRQFVNGALAIDLEAIVIRAAIALDRIGFDPTGLSIAESPDSNGFNPLNPAQTFTPSGPFTLNQILHLQTTFQPDLDVRDIGIPLAQKFCSAVSR